jgi:predicted RNase H-like HicB family nuclease
MSEFGRVFDNGVESGIYTKTQEIVVMMFYSSEDDAWFATLKNSPGLSAFGETPADALREFCVMLPAALDSGLSVEDVSNPVSVGGR